MSGAARTSEGPPLRRSPAGALLALLLGLAVLTGCGIRLSSGSDTTELFKGLIVQGDFRAGGRVSVTLQYAQPYPVTVDVACDLRHAHFRGTPTPQPAPGTTTPARLAYPPPTPVNKLFDIVGWTIPVNTDGGPVDEATPILGSFEHTFIAPQEPGRYVVKCYTPRDTNNAISRNITIVPASDQ